MKIATINLTNSSGEQAINIPEDMRINDDKVYLKKIGNSLQIIPYHNAWQNLIDSTGLFTKDFLEVRIQPDKQQREFFD